jgi:DNA-binding LytR/AlgR family response regulator
MEYDYSKQIGHKIMISEKSKRIHVNMEDITHITCDGYVSTVHLVDETKYSEARLLKHFEEELADYGFLRTSHNILVNSKYLLKEQTIKGRLHLSVHGIEIVVSKRKASVFRKH